MTGRHAEFLLSLNTTIPTDDLFERAYEFPKFWQPFYGVIPNQRNLDWNTDRTVFTRQILTRFGNCHTFNLPEMEKQFQVEK